MTIASKIVDELRSRKKLDITLLADESSPCVVSEWLSTGCVALDKIMGGGLPVGRITEIYGDTSTGKSLIAAQVAAMAQQADWLVTYVDTETAVSIPIMKDVGVDIDNLIYYAPDTVEEVFQCFQDAIEIKNKLAKDMGMLLIWDSVAASSTRREMEQEYGKSQMGQGANTISQGLRKITRLFSRNRICALFLNQTREKIGVLFGDNETTYGGKALPFYASIRLRLKLGQKLKTGKRVIGLSTRASTVKNKVAMPFLGCELPIYFGHGIDDPEASLMYLKAAGLIEGTSHKHITIGDQDVTFNAQTWAEIYDKNFDAIADMIMAHDADSEIVEEAEDVADN